MTDTLKIERLTGYAYFATFDRRFVDIAMEGDNESRALLIFLDYKEISEVEYWRVKFQQAREARDLKMIAAALDDLTPNCEVPL